LKYPTGNIHLEEEVQFQPGDKNLRAIRAYGRVECLDALGHGVKKRERTLRTD
jgi:hypothetical protein